MSIKHKTAAVLGLGAVMAFGIGGVALAAPSNPGPGNIDPEIKASLTIHKYKGDPVDPAMANDGSLLNPGPTNDPLKGVSFKACPVTGLNIHDPADWPTITKLNTAIQDSAIHAFPTTGFDGVSVGTDCLTGTTNDDGEILWSAVTQGVYYVTETGAPTNVAEHTLPFLVTVPMAHPSNNTWIYDVHVYPKNAVMTIDKAANDAEHVGVGSTVSWDVTMQVPDTQRNFEDYRLRDVLDSRLTYVADSMKLVLGGTEMLATDYTLTTTDNTLLVVLTSAGLTKLDAAKPASLVWTFDTVVTSIGNGVIENDASVMTNNPTGNWTDDGLPSEKVSSNWGAVEILKYGDKDNTKFLSNAVFQVFGSEADANACVTAVTAAKGSLPAGCDNAVKVTRDAAGNEVTPAQDKFTTGTDGKVVIPGLHVGIDDSTTRGYWLVEIVPPAGFINANAVYPITVTAGAIGSDAMVTQDVPNAQEPPTTMPQTGAVVSGILIAASIALGGGAVFLLAGKNRKNASEVA